MKQEIKIDDLVKEFEDMAKRGGLLARGEISQEDLLIQILGAICKIAMEK